jgi:predicted ATPase
LLLFVGDNNSGKSYLMSLLWGILTIGKEIFPFKESSVESYQKCDKWLTEYYGKEIEIDDVVETFFVNWFNELLDREKKISQRKYSTIQWKLVRLKLRILKGHLS